jgi:hypothetical protein
MEGVAFTDMAALLAKHLNIRPADYPAYVARLRSLQRVGLCADRRPGSGRVSLFTPREVIAFYVAAYLNLAGLRRETAAKVAQESGAGPIGKRIVVSLPIIFGSRLLRVSVNVPGKLLVAASGRGRTRADAVGPADRTPS